MVDARPNSCRFHHTKAGQLSGSGVAPAPILMDTQVPHGSSLQALETYDACRVTNFLRLMPWYTPTLE